MELRLVNIAVERAPFDLPVRNLLLPLCDRGINRLHHGIVQFTLAQGFLALGTHHVDERTLARRIRGPGEGDVIVHRAPHAAKR